jgi:fumarate reductase subunit C
MYSLSIDARHACGVYSRWVMALRNVLLVFLNIITKIELTLVLMVTNYYYKLSTKQEKGHISTSNIELGFKLTELLRFW